MSNNSEIDENLTVSRVYETLKSPPFLQNLYWDILSGIKEKNTYKLMRGIAEGLVNRNMKRLEELNKKEPDSVLQRAIVSETIVMSYTIDKVFSKILYIKLEKACKEQIVNIIHELKNEGKIPENVWSRFNLNTEAPGSQTSSQNIIVESNPVQQKKEVQKVPTRVGRRRRKATSNYEFQDIKRANSNKEILDDLKKVNGLKYTDEDESSVSNKKGNSSKEGLLGDRTEFFKKSLKKNTPIATTSLTLKKLTKENVSKLPNSVDNFIESNATTSKNLMKIDNEDVNDAASDVSFDRVSVVSSVHTSDLSSFDDEISLSSDDENGEKRKMPLKEVVKIFSGHGDPNSSSTTKQIDVTSSKSQTKVSANAKAKNLSQSAFEPQSENGLPKRMRKPNSRYSSDNMLCPAVKVKERKKSISSVKTYEKMYSDELTQKNKKAKLGNDIYVDVVTITKSMNNEGSNNSTMKTPPKKPETPEMFKSHSANRSLTSRRTAPLTLFST